MYTVFVPAMELWDRRKKEFIVLENDQTFMVEHSLVSISKWESTWEKPFLTEEPKTREENLDYIRCMTTTENVDPIVYHCLSDLQIQDIFNYAKSSRTASWFDSTNKRSNTSEQITSELIYYWMFEYNIPIKCETWHLNRLLTLIRIFGEKKQPETKMSQQETLNMYAKLNAERKRKYKTKG